MDVEGCGEGVPACVHTCEIVPVNVCVDVPDCVRMRVGANVRE